MQKKQKKSVIRQSVSLMNSRELADALTELIERKRGELGFLLSTLRKRPRTFNPYVMKGISIYSEPSALDRKTAELAAVAAAAALRCEHCIEAHISRAADEGASLEEILDVILISGAISESSTLSVALRKYKQHEGKLKRATPAGKKKQTG